MKQADRLGAKIVVIYGDQEASEGKVILKNLETVTQEVLPLEEAIARLKQT